MSEISNRTLHYLAVVGIVAMVLISVMAGARPAAPIIGNESNGRTLQVSGVGTVTSKPDQAALYLAVKTQSTSAAEAAANNAIIMTRVLDALGSISVCKEFQCRDSIQTVSYTLTPMYERQDLMVPGKITGYTARNAILLTLSDFNLVGKALDTAILSGVNEVQSITFGFAKLTYASLKKQALQLAAQEAESEAKAIASTIGVIITGPISITPGYAYAPRTEVLSATTPVQPGTLQVTATVQVVYQFR